MTTATPSIGQILEPSHLAIGTRFAPTKSALMQIRQSRLPNEIPLPETRFCINSRIGASEWVDPRISNEIPVCAGYISR